MIWVKRGSVGREVVDVQARLLRLGYELGVTGVDGIFGPETERAVILFQRKRGRETDGIVGPETWREMVDASYRLGDRQLYLKEPPLRGDDVRELQATLNNLGFNAGRVSGVFANQTDKAVREFQKNVGLDPDGIVGETSIQALDNYRMRVSSGGITGVWDREMMQPHDPLRERRVAIDSGDDAVSRAIAAVFAEALKIEAAVPFVLYDMNPEADVKDRAIMANELEADLLVDFESNASEQAGRHGATCEYFDNREFFSARSKQLAGMIQDELTAALKVFDNGIEGKNLTILQATRMPAVVVKPGFTSDVRDREILESQEAPGMVAAAVVAALKRYWQE
ncbi:MAG: peptidoglycan-binding protein [Actinomycetota bacterium]